MITKRDLVMTLGTIISMALAALRVALIAIATQ